MKLDFFGDRGLFCLGEALTFDFLSVSNIFLHVYFDDDLLIFVGDMLIFLVDFFFFPKASSSTKKLYSFDYNDLL